MITAHDIYFSLDLDILGLNHPLCNICCKNGSLLLYFKSFAKKCIFNLLDTSNYKKLTMTKTQSSILVFHFWKHALPGWRHECLLRKYWENILEWYFDEGMGTNSAGEKVKKRGMTKFCSKTKCTQSKWANEQTIKTSQRIVLKLQVWPEFQEYFWFFFSRIYLSLSKAG